MLHFRINTEQRLLTLRLDGTVTVAQWRRVLTKVLAECPEAVGFDMLSDVRSPHSMLRIDQVVQLARMKRGLGMHRHPRRSVSLVDGKVNFGFSRLFELFSGDESRVARFTTDSIAAAADWLCRPVSVIRAELNALEKPARTRARGPRTAGPK